MSKILQVVTILSLILMVSSQQWYRSNNRYYWRQDPPPGPPPHGHGHGPPPPPFRPPPPPPPRYNNNPNSNVQVTTADWVCKNSNGDMIILAEDDNPSDNGNSNGNNNNNFNTNPWLGPNNNQPEVPNTTPYVVKPEVRPTRKPQPPSTTENVNTNGEGQIDIRFGSR